MPLVLAVTLEAVLLEDRLDLPLIVDACGLTLSRGGRLRGAEHGGQPQTGSEHDRREGQRFLHRLECLKVGSFRVSEASTAFTGERQRAGLTGER